MTPEPPISAGFAGLGIDLSGSTATANISSITYPAATLPAHCSNHYPSAARNTTDSGTSSNEKATTPKFSMRSSVSAMHGLTSAEFGESMVVFDRNTGSFTQGQKISYDCITPGGSSRRKRSQSTPLSPITNASLSRHGTLLTADPSRNAAQLKTLLGKSNLKVKKGAMAAGDIDGAPVALELAKSACAVQCDITLQNPICVQGSYLKGMIHVKIRPRSKKELPIQLAGGKIRIVGIESIPNQDNQPFFQCSSQLLDVSGPSNTLYESGPDREGFCYVADGSHSFPFAFLLPLDVPSGNAKGSFRLQSGVAVRYIVVVSFKVKNTGSGRISIAHFYRNCAVWPRIDPSSVLTPASAPLKADAYKSFFMGGRGEVTLIASLHRLHWIAGQRCYVKVQVNNETKKTIRAAMLTLVRKIVVYKPQASRGDLEDVCGTSTSVKRVAQNIIEMGEVGGTHKASAKGWWTGVACGDRSVFSLSLLIPANAISISRGKLVEVEYSLVVKLTAGTGSSLDVTLPLQIISFLSIDPPPSSPLPQSATTSNLDLDLLDPVVEIDQDAPLWSPHEVNDYLPQGFNDDGDPHCDYLDADTSEHSITTIEARNGGTYNGVHPDLEEEPAPQKNAEILHPTESVARFADLYHASLQDLSLPASDSTKVLPQSASTKENSPSPRLSEQPERSISPFALRVQNKLRIHRQSSHPDTSTVSQHAPTSDDEDDSYRSQSYLPSHPSLRSSSSLDQDISISTSSLLATVTRTSSAVKDRFSSHLESPDTSYGTMDATRINGASTVLTEERLVKKRMSSLSAPPRNANSVQAKIKEFEARMKAEQLGKSP